MSAINIEHTLAVLRLQDWLLTEHDVLVSAQRIEAVMSTPFPDEPDLYEDSEASP